MSSEYGADAVWLGQLQGLFENTSVTDITVDQQGELWVDYGFGLKHCEWHVTPTAEGLKNYAMDLIAAGGKHVDFRHPIVDVSLDNGLRVHVALPPIVQGSTVISIRRNFTEHLTLESLNNKDAGAPYFPKGGLHRLRGMIRARKNLLITGSTGAGKTTLLRAIMAEIPEEERIIAVEEIPELAVNRPNLVQLLARQANTEGVGGISAESLIRETLRMRPDRIILGEVRGREFAAFLSAMNTGHDGGALSCHANGLTEVPARLEALGLLCGWDETVLASQVIHSLHAIVHVERTQFGRRIAGFGSFTLNDGRLSVREIPSDSADVILEYAPRDVPSRLTPTGEVVDGSGP